MGWTRGGVVGRGSTATVSTATITATGEVFAVKSAVLSQSETLQREQQFLSILSSPYVVSYKGCEITKEDNKLMYNLLMQYMPEGTIIDAIGRRKSGRLSESIISNYTGQILKGLEYLHSNGIVHCDIKGANLLVGKEGGGGGGVIKIADLGCAKWVGDDVAAVRGTPMFMAPEVARGEEQGFPADIWAVGCVVIEMASGSLPWMNVDDPVSVLYKIAFSGESPEIPDGFSRQANDFIGKCLIQDPKERWGVKRLLKHPFLKRFNRRTLEIIDQDFCRNSPTSILDQDVWSSMEESVSVGIDSCQPPCSSSSLRQRIKQLAGNPDKEEPKCEEEINWMMIRSNQNSWELEG